jgi:hypothetical protein
MKRGKRAVGPISKSLNSREVVADTKIESASIGVILIKATCVNLGDPASHAALHTSGGGGFCGLFPGASPVAELHYLFRSSLQGSLRHYHAS